MSQSPEPVTYAYSVKLESTAKGLIMPTIYIYGNDMETARKPAILLATWNLQTGHRCITEPVLSKRISDCRAPRTWMMRERKVNDKTNNHQGKVSQADL